MGNRSIGVNRDGGVRTSVRLPGFFLSAEICVPRSHPHALWLLPWIEALAMGSSWEELTNRPPWPEPADPLVVRHLTRALIDLRWAVPDWSGDRVELDPGLKDAFDAGGRVRLARRLFDAEVIRGEWWVDGLSGTILSRQTAIQFDWDLRREADMVLEPVGRREVQEVVDGGAVDFVDLLRKLGGNQRLWGGRERAFLGTSLRVGDPKDLFFIMYGASPRLLPHELSELELGLLAHAPQIFGDERTASARVVHHTSNPVERLLSELEQLPSDPVMLGPDETVRARCERLVELCDELEEPLAHWIDQGTLVRSVAGATARHFDALAEMCGDLQGHHAPVVLMTSAFLNVKNVHEPLGIVHCLRCAPADARVLLVYGHAGDDTPSEQARDIECWRDALFNVAPEVARRVTLVAGEHRSHEKVILTSLGGWMLGSWNPASSHPKSSVFECSLAGQDPRVAMALFAALKPNICAPRANDLVERLGRALEEHPTPAPRGIARTQRLREAAALLQSVAPGDEGVHGEVWTLALRHLRAIFRPFVYTTKLEVLDQHQTRDALVSHVRFAKHSVLVASDRLTESALGAPLLKDLGGDSRCERLIRLVWGREWAGNLPGDGAIREQLDRARVAVSCAKRYLGDALLASEFPMENHGKALIVDAMRGIVTSENLLSYGGEKGRYESRELGLAFWGPSLSRELSGKFLHHWPELLDGGATPDAALAWIVLGSEAWYSCSAIEGGLDFEWRDPDYIEAILRAELDGSSKKRAVARREAFEVLSRRVGGQVGSWLREEGERLGVLGVDTRRRWRPWETDTSFLGEDDLAQQAKSVMDDLTVRGEPQPDALRGERGQDPLVARILGEMVSIPSGTFLMGDRRVREERPVHRVTISRPFQMSAKLVTQGLWEEVMGSLPSLRDVERHPDNPIIHISKREIDAFLDRLNTRLRSGRFELPTEAQWEYACRAGSSDVYCFGDDSDELERFAWTKRNSTRRLQRVGLLEPNSWGLFDMHGLVYETMRDGPRKFTHQAVVDPVGPLDGDRIVARGGCWSRYPVDRKRPWSEHFRCASRQRYEKGHRCSLRLVWLEEGK